MEVTDDTGCVRHWEAIAVGGGMIEMQTLEQFGVNICGDFYELLVVVNMEESTLKYCEQKIQELVGASEFTLYEEGTKKVQKKQRTGSRKIIEGS